MNNRLNFVSRFVLVLALVLGLAPAFQLPAAAMVGVQSVNVQMYGATGDGTHNDAPALQAALNYLNSQGGGTLLLPRGTYLINSTINMTNMRAVQLVGTGGQNGSASSGTQIKIGVDNTHAFTLSGTKGCVFRDLQVTRSSSFTGTGDGWHGSAQTSDCRWLDCLVTNCDVGVYLDNAWQNYFRGCVFTGCKKGALITVAGGSNNDTKFIGCSFFSSKTYGLHINANTVYVDHCDFESSTSDTSTLDIFGQYGQNCVISGNTSMYKGMDLSMIRPRIIGNSLVAGTMQRGIMCRNSIFAPVIIGNTVEGSIQPGIYLRSCAQAIVDGNLVRNSVASTGITLENSSDCVVSNNVCYDDQGTPTQTYGIASTGTSDNNVISGNDCRNNATGGFSLVGTNAQITANLPSTGDLVWIGGKRHTSGTAAPTSGTYAVGDTVYNTAPAAGSPVGWTCTVAGTPGTWVPISIAGTVLPIANGGTGASTLAGANIPVTNAANTWTGAAQIFGAGINHNGGTFQLNGTRLTQIGNGYFTSYGQNLRFRTNDNGTPFDSYFETGNVGIGMSSGAGALLDVAGTGRIQGIATTGSGVVRASRVATASPVTVATSDHYVFTKLTVAGAVAVNLPSSPTTGQVFIIKDAKGDAGANNVTITPAAGTIDGAASYVLNVNYGSVTLIYNGTEWSVI
jgi:hypothetical protein